MTPAMAVYASVPFATQNNSFSFSKALIPASAPIAVKAALTSAKSLATSSAVVSTTINQALTAAKLSAAACTLEALEDPQPIF